MQEKPKVLLVGKVRERIAERLEDEAEVVRCVAPLVPGALGPVLAAAIAVPVLGEIPDAVALIGLAATTAGVLLASGALRSGKP